MNTKLWTVGTKHWVKGLLIILIPLIASEALAILQGQQTIELWPIIKPLLMASITYIGASFSQGANGNFGTNQ